MPETADTELQFPANFLKSFEISIQRRQNFSISCNNLVKLAMSFSTHLFQWKSPLFLQHHPIRRHAKKRTVSSSLHTFKLTRIASLTCASVCSSNVQIQCSRRLLSMVRSCSQRIMDTWLNRFALNMTCVGIGGLLIFFDTGATITVLE